MLGLVVYQPSEMVNHFLPAPPAPPAKPPDRDKLIENWLDAPSLGEKPSTQPRLCARNHIQPRPSTRYNKPYGLTRPSCLILTLAVNLLVILDRVSTIGAIRSEPETANPSYWSTYFKLVQQTLPSKVQAQTEPAAFDLLFTSYANGTRDPTFSRLKLDRNEITRLDSHQKASLYASLMQFKSAIDMRISAVVEAILNITLEHKAFSDTLLFTTDQGPYAFKSLVLV
jgi:hypothetical protein